LPIARHIVTGRAGATGVVAAHVVDALKYAQLPTIVLFSTVGEPAQFSSGCGVAFACECVTLIVACVFA